MRAAPSNPDPLPRAPRRSEARADPPDHIRPENSPRTSQTDQKARRCYHNSVNLPKLPVAIAIGLLALMSAACMDVANPEGWAAPVFDDDTIYYFPDKDRLSAVAITTDGGAALLWTFPPENQGDEDVDIEAVYGEPVIDGDRIYFAGWEGAVYAVSAQSGQLLWTSKGRVDITGGVVSGPVLNGDRLYIGTTEGRVYALTTENGTAVPEWPEGGLRLGKGVWAPPILANDTLYIATMDGELYALSPQTGEALWPEPFEADSGAIPDLALINDGTLWVPTLGKRVYFVDTETGTAIGNSVETADWVWTRPAINENEAYFGDFGGLVHALDITTLADKWETDTEHKIKAAPVLIGDTLVVADRSPAVIFLDAETGERKNTVPLLDAGTVRANLVERDGVAYVLTTRGRLFRADPIAGAPD
jgi:outer membrane protein assembly factor BamB